MKGLISIVMISVSLLGLSNAYANHEEAAVAVGVVHDAVNKADGAKHSTMNEKAAMDEKGDNVALEKTVSGE